MYDEGLPAGCPGTSTLHCRAGSSGAGGRSGCAAPLASGGWPCWRGTDRSRLCPRCPGAPSQLPQIGLPALPARVSDPLSSFFVGDWTALQALCRAANILAPLLPCCNLHRCFTHRCWLLVHDHRLIANWSHPQWCPAGSEPVTLLTMCGMCGLCCVSISEPKDTSIQA
jgi:hypothetical protein